MSLKLKHEIFEDYLWVEFTGNRNIGKEVVEVIAILKQVATIARTADKKSIMIVSKIKGRLPVASAFGISESFKSIGWLQDFKIAGVVPNHINFVNLSILETIMVNLGYECKIFHHENKAKKWLLSI